MFEEQQITIDGNEYVKCLFLRCQITFTATAPVSFQDCTFDRCDWAFEDAAERTLIYLSALYRGLGPGGQDLVEGIFDSIRTGVVEEGVLLPGPMARA